MSAFVNEYVTCGECRKDRFCMWGPGCGAPRIAEFEGYAPVRIGIFFYRGWDYNYVMDDFGQAVKVPPPVQGFPFTEKFNISAMGAA